MAIDPIGAQSQIPLLSLSKPAADQQTDNTFTDMVGNAIDNLSKTQNHADDLAVKAATGDLTDVHDYMIASTEATLATELTVAVRNKALEAFNDIMRMPV